MVLRNVPDAKGLKEETMEPLISIIVPAYNVAPWLPRCLDSILAQTHTNLEVLVVDDGSKDDTSQILRDYAAIDSRICPIFKENGGVAKARNTAMAKANGAYFMFVDSDDYLPADAVQVLLERMMRDGSDLAIGKHLWAYEDGGTDGRNCDFMEDQLLTPDELLLQMGKEPQYNVAPWGRLYDRKCLRGIEFPPMTCAEDMYIFPDVIQQCGKISIVSHNVYFYFQRKGSIIHTKKDRQNLECIHSHQHMIDVFLRKGMYRCAGLWFKFAVRIIQEMQDMNAGAQLMKQAYTQAQIKKMLQNAGIITRIKWFLVRKPKAYRLVFDFKNKYFG